MIWILGSCFVMGLLLAGSDGPLWGNLLGLALLGVAAVGANRMEGRNGKGV